MHRVGIVSLRRTSILFALALQAACGGNSKSNTNLSPNTGSSGTSNATTGNSTTADATTATSAATMAGSGGSADSTLAGGGGTIILTDGASPEDVPECFQPMDAGSCTDFSGRYYFDSESGTCKEFMYGGCEGNDNNFPTKVSCTQYCQGLQTCSCATGARDCETGACKACPVDFNLAQESPCEALGLECQRDQAICECAENDGGEALWSCQIFL